MKEAEEKADVSLCFLHVGEEYAGEPTEEVKKLCERLIDAGADVIFCAHPHVVQPMEWVTTAGGSKGLVFYSLGNFVSNQPYPETILGAVATLTFTADGVSEAEMKPVVCHYAGRETTVYFLEDYTEELAAAQALNRQETVFTLESLWEMWEKETEGRP